MPKYLSIAEIRAQIPGPRGKPINKRTVALWIHRGVRGIRLKAIKPSYYWLVLQDDLDAFLEAIQGSRRPDAVDRVLQREGVR